MTDNALNYSIHLAHMGWNNRRSHVGSCRHTITYMWLLFASLGIFNEGKGRVARTNIIPMLVKHVLPALYAISSR